MLKKFFIPTEGGSIVHRSVYSENPVSVHDRVQYEQDSVQGFSKPQFL